MTLYGAVGELNREGRVMNTFIGKFSPLGTVIVKTPYAIVDTCIYTVMAIGPIAPKTVVATWEITGNIVQLFGWQLQPGIAMPLIPTEGEEEVSFVTYGKLRTN